MDRQGSPLDPSDLKAPAPSRDDVRYPRPPRRPLRERWRKPRHVGRWLIAGFFLLSFVSAAFDDEKNQGSQAPIQRVAELPDNPIASGYLLRVQAVCRARDRAISEDPGLKPMDEILRFELETTSLIEAVPHPPEAAALRRIIVQARRKVDRVTLATYRGMAASPTPTKTFYEEYASLVRRTVSETYTIFAGIGVDCETADG